MSYYFVAHSWDPDNPKSSCYLRPIGYQKRKGRHLGRKTHLHAQYRLPKLRPGDLVEVEQVQVRYHLSGGSYYAPVGFIRRVGRNLTPKPRKRNASL